ncbi:MAG: Na/Pi symporter, partial [Desulfuromonadales bacterium]
IFLGMNIMGEGMAPLRDYPPFIDLMRNMARPGMGILCGAIFTALIQSSSATTGIVVVMATQGFISLPAGIALALGANVGTCATAMLAAMGKTRPAVRAACIHVLFNLLGVLLWVEFIDQLTALARFISPTYTELSGIERVAAEAPRQIANANTIFNLANTLVFISLTAPMARLVTWLLPDRPAEMRIVSPLFLDDQLISTPSLALNVARLETGHLGDQILKMMLMAQSAIQKSDRLILRELEKQDDAADILHADINVYLNRVGKETLTEEESKEHFRIGRANAYLESIGDVLETDLASLGYKWVDLNMHASETMQMLLNDLFEGVFEGLECAVKTIKDNDLVAAQQIISMKGEINLRVNAALEHQSLSLAESGETRLETLNAEFELTDKLKRIFTLSKRIARLWVPKEV